MARDGNLTSRTYRLPLAAVSEVEEAARQEAERSGLGAAAGAGNRPQFAVHLATTSVLGVTTPLDGITREYDKLTKEELLRR